MAAPLTAGADAEPEPSFAWMANIFEDNVAAAIAQFAKVCKLD